MKIQHTDVHQSLSLLRKGTFGQRNITQPSKVSTNLSRIYDKDQHVESDSEDSGIDTGESNRI